MVQKASWLEQALARGDFSRRDFLKFCGGVAAAFSLPKSAAAQIAEQVEQAKKPVVVWLEFQDCAGNTEAMLRGSRPPITDVLLDTISVDYHETLMAAAGHQAEEALAQTVEANSGEFIAVVEGSIPGDASSGYCMIGGRSALEIAREVCEQAAATIAIGNCAAYGGIPAASPNPTGAISVREAVPKAKNLINIPACPANAENLTGTIVYYLAFGRWPPLDIHRRPLFAFGKSIHDACERRAHFDGGQYAEEWGDDAHRAGHCLYKLGCKGPVTWQNCPVVRWNGGTSWPVQCGHGCIGCAEPKFWDRMTPFYRHLEGIPGFGVHSNIDTIGGWATAGVAAAFAAHGVVQAVERTARGREEKKRDDAKAAAKKKREES